MRGMATDGTNLIFIVFLLCSHMIYVAIKHLEGGKWYVKLLQNPANRVEHPYFPTPALKDDAMVVLLRFGFFGAAYMLSTESPRHHGRGYHCFASVGL